MILTCSNIKKSFGAEDILENITFILEEKEKAAVVGVNGAGKTTLFRILAGETQADSGSIAYKKESTVQYMPQNITIDSEQTMYNEMLSVFSDVIELENTMRSLERQMASSNQLDSLMEKYNRATEQFEKKNGYEYISRVKGIIKGLGFTEEDGSKKMSLLSGGEKTRVALGKMLLAQPDLLLLDEPTNHLDLDSIAWLETFLQNYGNAILIISHDRYFLDKTVTKVIDIENKKSIVYLGNYTDFSVQKEIARDIALRQYVNQQKEIRRQEEVIRVLRSYKQEKFYKRAQSREKQMAKIELVEKPEDLPQNMRIVLEAKVKSGNDVLFGENLSKRFGTRILFKDVNFEIKKGEKVALIGPNGIGKTTLFRIVQNMLEPDTGKVRYGTNVKIGYYDQEHMNIDTGKTIFNEIYDSYPKLTVTEIRNTLAAFIFTGDEVFKEISLLSGGERGRVALAKIMLGNANFLLLDEPTNHLDMYSKDILESAINSYDGTVLYISHDRYFINSTADKILELSPTGIKTYLGNYDSYLEKKASDASSNEERKLAETESESKAEHIKKKVSQSEQRKLQAEIRKCENSIAEVEGEIKAYNIDLTKEEVYTSPELSKEVFEKKTAAEERLIGLYKEWEKLSELQ